MCGTQGTIVGPAVSDGLKSVLGADKVATQGADYAALLSTNLLPGGADPAGISKMSKLINQAASQCADARIFVSGYR